MFQLNNDVLYSGKVPQFQARHQFHTSEVYGKGARVVGVMGSKRCGKDTFALAMIEEGAKRGIEIRRLAFADALYHEVAAAFGVTVEFLRRDDIKDVPVPELSLANCKDSRFVALSEKLLQEPVYAEKGLTVSQLSPRFCLQKWGTDYRRMMDRDDYWRAVVVAQIKAAPAHIRFIITDVRFPDEANVLIDEFNAVTVRVTRRKVDQLMAELRAAGDPTACHLSEIALLGYVTDYISDNVEGDFNAVRRDAITLL